MSRQEEIRQLIINLQRRLQKLKEQQALQGLSSDPKIAIEIEDIEKEIEGLRAELKGLPPSETSNLDEKPYVVSAIRLLLLKAFTKKTLEEFCSDNFKEVTYDFTPFMSFRQKVDLLVEYCEKWVIVDKLLFLIEKHNPDQYELFIFDIFPQIRHRSDIERLVISAFNDIVGIAGRNSGVPYRDVAPIAQRNVPELFNPESSFLIQRQKLLSPEAQRYQRKAEIQRAALRKNVTAINLIDQELDENLELQKQTETEADKKWLRKDFERLIKIRRELEENDNLDKQLILNLRDKSELSSVQLPTFQDNHEYQEFDLTGRRALRIRVTHPVQPERANGVDIIYEYYWRRKKLVRFAAVQYQIWNGKTLIKDKILHERLNNVHLCYCMECFRQLPKSDENKTYIYRLPYCSVFLCLTDQLKFPGSPLRSSDYHIPVHAMENRWLETTESQIWLAKENLREHALKGDTFVELFNTNTLGSRWLSYEELEALYHSYDHFTDIGDRIIIYAQDFSY